MGVKLSRAPSCGEETLEGLRHEGAWCGLVGCREQGSQRQGLSRCRRGPAEPRWRASSQPRGAGCSLRSAPHLPAPLPLLSPSSSVRAVGWGRAGPSFPPGRFSFRPGWEQPSRRGPSSGASDKPHHLQLRRDAAKLQSDKRYETWRYTSGWLCAPCQLCSSPLSPRGPYVLLRVF